MDGETGFPFIDCFMRELKSTGYCNHMGRETAGWFLIADLGLDWRMAAEWFESVLSLADDDRDQPWYLQTSSHLKDVKKKVPSFVEFCDITSLRVMPMTFF